MTAVHHSAFYGWPYSDFRQHMDTWVRPSRPNLVASAVVPNYALDVHAASLGLLPSRGST